MNLPCDIFFSAKGATGFLTPDAYPLVCQTQGFGDLPAVLVGNLRAFVKVHAPIFPGNRDRTLRFHEEMLHEWREKCVFNDHVRLGETCIQIALAHLDFFEQIPILMHLFRVRLSRLHRVAYHRTGFNDHPDTGDSLIRDCLRVRCHDRDGIPYVSHPFSNTHQDRPVF